MNNNKRVTKNVLYMKVKDKIIQFMQENNVKAHDLLPSEAELAQTYGVSRMTCKLALQQLVDDGLVYRLPRRGTFVSEKATTQLHSQTQQHSHHRLGLIVPQIDEYVSRIITAVTHEADKMGYDILLKISDGVEQKEDDILAELSRENRVQGIILFPVDRKQCGDGLLRLKLDKFPVVVLDRVFKEIHIDSVSHNHYEGAYEITKYLIEQGHQQIGYISHTIQDATSREERFQGFVQCMLDHHVPFQYQRNLTDVDWKKGLSGGAQSGLVKEALPSIEQYLKENPQLSAVFCMNDYLAAHVIYAAHNIGLNVPTQLSVTGFLDITLTHFLPVSLTTVKQPTQELGQEAIRLLAKRMADVHSKPTHIQITTELMIRDSTCPVSVTTTNT